MEETIVKEWLCSLKLGQYAESFIDNGYDDLEICKQIDAPDLDAIGVVDLHQRSKLLQAVQVLRVEGAASVYFTVEEAQAARLENISRNSDPGPHFERHPKIQQGTGSSASTPGDAKNTISTLCNLEIDAYEAGKAELVRLPQLHLRQLLKDNLLKDKVDLTVHPYTLEEGQRGILEGLASRYADVFNTHYQDVLEHLEYLRCHEWNILVSQRAKAATIAARSYPFLHGLSSVESAADSWANHSSSSSSIDSDEDQPIYLPGKYNPSSCLSDAEEDQIYGFTGQTPVPNVSKPLPGYLNPRSQHIYELPPVRGHSHNGTKKRLGIRRFLKTLKRDLKRSSDSKTKYMTQNTISSPRPQTAGSDLSSTPLVVLPGYSSPTSSHCSQSSRSHSSNHSFVVNSTSAPGTPGSSGPVRDSGLQDAIEKLKQQEIQKRREDQFREHEQILQDLRFGLALTKAKKSAIESSTYAPIPNCFDSSYEYEENMKRPAKPESKVASSHPQKPHCQHWYDEPPYESDPEDFLISKDMARSSKSICSTRPTKEDDVISLKIAGDITLSRDMVATSSQGWLQSPSSRCSSEETPQDTYKGGTRVPSTSFPEAPHAPSTLSRHDNSERIPPLSQQQRKSRSIDTERPNVEPEATNTHTDVKRRDSASLVGRMKGLHRDMQKKITRLRGSREHLDSTTMSKTSYDLPYQRQSSLPVKWRMGAAGDKECLGVRSNDGFLSAIIGQAKTLVDHTTPFGPEELKFQKGDIIDILNKSSSGIWKGHLNGAIGLFEAISVEENVTPVRHPKRFGISHETLPSSPVNFQDVPSLLASLRLSHLTQNFLMNGVTSIEALQQLRPDKFVQLGITNPEVINKVMSAMLLLENNSEMPFVRRTNGRITLPATTSPYYQNCPYVASSLYENTGSFHQPVEMSYNSSPPEQPFQTSPNQDEHLSGSYHAHVALVEPSASTPSDTLEPTLC